MPTSDIDSQESWRMGLSTYVINLNGTVGAVGERTTAVLRVAGSIPARNKYSYDLQIVVSGLAVCVCDFICF